VEIYGEAISMQAGISWNERERSTWRDVDPVTQNRGSEE